MLTVENRALRAVVTTEDYAPTLQTDFSLSSIPDDGLYVGVENTLNGGVASADFSQVSDSKGLVVVSMMTPAVVGPGTYTDTITLRVCYDELCQKPVQGSPVAISVVYEVREAPPPTTMSIQTTQFVEEGRPGGAARTLSTLVYFDGAAAPNIVLRTLYSGNPQSTGIKSVEVVRVSDAQRRVDIHLVDPDDLVPQQYSTQITLEGCYDASCSRRAQSGSTTISVVYHVSEFALQAAQRVATGANDLVWDPASQKFYLSFPSSAGDYANRIAVLDPVSGQITGSAFAGSEPRTLAVSGDGAYLYAGLGGATQVRRFKLPELTLDTTIELGATPPPSNPLFAYQLAVAPAQPQTVAVQRSDYSVAVYDDAVQRPVSLGGDEYASFNSIAWGDDSKRLFGYDFWAGLSVLDVNSGGVSMNRRYPEISGIQITTLHYAQGLLLSASGLIFDANTGSQVATLQSSRASIEALIPDAPAGRLYTVGHDYTDAYGMRRLTAWDLDRYVPLETQQIDIGDREVRKLVRWGDDGLALINDQGGVYLMPGAALTQ